MTNARVELLTGRLAEKALRRLVGQWGPIADFELVVIVLPINVVSLATLDWIGRHHTPGVGTCRIIIPGLCQGNLETLGQKWTTLVERGPEDYRDLPEFSNLRPIRWTFPATPFRSWRKLTMPRPFLSMKF